MTTPRTAKSASSRAGDRPGAHEDEVLGDEAGQAGQRDGGESTHEPQAGEDRGDALHADVVAHVLRSATLREPAGEQEHRGDRDAVGDHVEHGANEGDL